MRLSTIVFTAALVLTVPCRGQDTQTRVVDPEAGVGDFTTIGAAISNLEDATVRYTIYVNAGTYTETVTLGGTKENIDIVGRDPDAVIIEPDDGEEAFIIKGTGVRNNSIRNLTIKVARDDVGGVPGTGVLLQQDGAGTAPSDVTIDGVNIVAAGSGGRGIVVEDTIDNLIISSTSISTDGSSAEGVRIEAALDGAEFSALTLTCTGSGSSAFLADDSLDNTTLDLCTMKTTTGVSHCFEVKGQSEDLEITRSRFRLEDDGSHALVFRGGTSSVPSERIRIHDCQMVFPALSGGPHSPSKAIVFYDYADDVQIQNVYTFHGRIGDALAFPGSAFNTVRVDGLVVRGTHQGTGDIGLTNTTDARLVNVDVVTEDANVLEAGTDTYIAHSTIMVANRFGSAVSDGDDTFAVKVDGKSGLRVYQCDLQARLYGVWITGGADDIIISNSTITGAHSGLRIDGGADVRVSGCTILASSEIGNSSVHSEYVGVHLKKDGTTDPSEVVFDSCKISAHSAETADDATAIVADSGVAGATLFINCDIHAEQTATATNTATAYGVRADTADAIHLIGGSITSGDADDTETDQYDIKNESWNANPAVIPIRTSSVQFSKWLGPIGAVRGPRAVAQRVLDVADADDDAVLSATALTGTTQVITTGITNPDTYRALTATGGGGATGTATIVGTDWSGAQIADTVTIDGDPTNKPFRTVTKVILPAGGAGETVSIGTSKILGLQFPIDDTSVLDQSRKITVQSKSVYAVESLGTVDANYATVDVAATDLTTPQDLQWSANRSN